MTRSELLPIGVVTEMAGVSRWTWRRWVKAGQAPARVPNIPGHPRWSRASVEQFLVGRHGLRAFGSHVRQLAVTRSSAGSPETVERRSSES